MNLNRYVLMLMIMLLISWQKPTQEYKCIFFLGGADEQQIEVLNGDVKEVIVGDSLSLDILYHFYDHVYFTRKGNMKFSHEKYKDKTWDNHLDTVDIKETYTSIYNKAGRKTAMTATIKMHPDECSCSKDIQQWRFDTYGRITDHNRDIAKHKGYSHIGYTEYKYDSLGRIQYKTFESKFPFPKIYRYKYNADNRLVELDRYEQGDLDKEANHFVGRTTFEYQEFDAHNNWVKRIEHLQWFNPMPKRDTTYIVARKITYY